MSTPDYQNKVQLHEIKAKKKESKIEFENQTLNYQNNPSKLTLDYFQLK